MNDAWSVLGIAPGSDMATIRAAHRKLVMVLHPDVAGNDPNTITRFQEVQNAYEFLSRKTHPSEQARFYQCWIGLEEVMTGCVIDITIDQRAATIDVPCGVHSGDRIIADSDEGKIVVEIMIKAHDQFQRRFSDLLTILPIDAIDAMLGTKQTISAFGRKIQLDIPAGIQHGDIVTIFGEGCPARGEPSIRGNLLILAQIILSPAKSEEISLLKQIQGLRAAAHPSNI